MISIKATLEVVAVVSLALLAVAHISVVVVVAQQQLSDSYRYQVDTAGNHLSYYPREQSHQDQQTAYYLHPGGAYYEADSQGAPLENRLLPTVAASDEDDLIDALSGAQPNNAHGYNLDFAPWRWNRTLLGVGSHWPASGFHEDQLQESAAEEGEISKPVNDPEEFEAKLGQLTDALNHKMPNTRMRQQLLLGLMNGSRRVETVEKQASPAALEQLMREQLMSELNEVARVVNYGQFDLGLEPPEKLDDTSESSSTGPSGNGGSEYIDRPLELSGHQYVQGGAGEGRQLLGPEGTFENVQVIKTDSAIPSYCDPPNPCPIGYTAKDGCLEEFVNLASFSREYQAKQKCSCDSEHSLFNCASPLGSPSSPSAGTNKHPNSLESRDELDAASSDQDEEDSQGEGEEEEESSVPTFGAATSNKLDTLARTIQNRFGDLASVQRLIGKQQELHAIQQQQQQQHEALSLAGNDDENSDYLVRSARKLSSLDMHHKLDLD